MARLLTSLFLLSVAGLCSAQAFGRFGYAEASAVPGFALRRDGFQVNSKGADLFQYMAPYSSWRCTDLSDMQATAIVSTEGLGPRKLSLNLLSPGFSLYFQSGFSLVVRSAECPFLTWTEGSVGADVPTPETDWTLVSFKNGEPPVLFSFPEGKCAVRIGGSPGAWTFRSVDVGPHWVRVVAPLGISRQPTSTAAELGILVKKIKPNLDVLTGKAPRLKSLEVHADESYVTGMWHFDRPGVALPTAAMFAAAGGYRAEILSPVRDLESYTEEGPLLACTTPDLVIKFPLRHVPQGRNLVLGTPEKSGSASLESYAAVVHLALAQLSCARDLKTRDLAAAESARFISEVQDVPEPFTGQKLPFQPTGKGMDVAAAEALLTATTSSVEARPVQSSALMLSLLLRRDWNTWQLWSGDPALSCRATTFAALACAFSEDAVSRLNGAMMAAGLCAESGLNQWRARLTIDSKPEQEFPLKDLMSGLFQIGDPTAQHPFAESLFGPIQVVSDLSLTARAASDHLVIAWFGQDETEKRIDIRSHLPLKIKAGKNISALTVKEVKDGLEVTIHPRDVGATELVVTCKEEISLPDSALVPLWK